MAGRRGCRRGEPRVKAPLWPGCSDSGHVLVAVTSGSSRGCGPHRGRHPGLGPDRARGGRGAKFTRTGRGSHRPCRGRPWDAPRHSHWHAALAVATEAEAEAEAEAASHGVPPDIVLRSTGLRRQSPPAATKPGLPFLGGGRVAVTMLAARGGSSLRRRQPQARAPGGRPSPAARPGVRAGHAAARPGVRAGHASAPAGRCVLALTHRQRACALCVQEMRALGLVRSCLAQAQSTVTVLIPGRSASAGAEAEVAAP